MQNPDNEKLLEKLVDMERRVDELHDAFFKPLPLSEGKTRLQLMDEILQGGRFVKTVFRIVLWSAALIAAIAAIIGAVKGWWTPDR